MISFKRNMYRFNPKAHPSGQKIMIPRPNMLAHREAKAQAAGGSVSEVVSLCVCVKDLERSVSEVYLSLENSRHRPVSQETKHIT